MRSSSAVICLFRRAACDKKECETHERGYAHYRRIKKPRRRGGQKFRLSTGVKIILPIGSQWDFPRNALILFVLLAALTALSWLLALLAGLLLPAALLAALPWLLTLLAGLLLTATLLAALIAALLVLLVVLVWILVLVHVSVSWMALNAGTPRIPQRSCWTTLIVRVRHRP
jgi:hypothetical protein